MKKIILIASFFTFTNAVFSQANTMINTKDLSNLSIGAMPVVFASESLGPGVGLELNSRYRIVEDFGFGVFARMKTVMDDRSVGYGEPRLSSNTTMSRNVFAYGAQVDYNLVRAVSFQLRAGYELEADPIKYEMMPRFIYGGGVLIKLRNSQTHKIGHSLRIGIDFESDKTINADYPTMDFSDFPYSQSIGSKTATLNSFSIQVGWNFQFNMIKKRR